MEVMKMMGFLLLFWIFCASPCLAIQHARNLIWAQTPALRLTVSRLVGIHGDPHEWVPAKSPSVKHISAPHYGWEFKGLGFNYRKQLLVWSEAMNKKIQALYLNGSTATMDIFTGTSSEVNGVAVDWVGNNVYWADALYNWVVMAPLRTYAETDRVFKIVLQEGLDNPHGLAVHPAHNMLLLSDWGVRPRIERMDLLGGGRHVLVDKDILEPRGLALDVSQMTLYWVDSAKATVESVSLLTAAAAGAGVGGGRGLRRKVVKIDAGSNFFDLALYDDYVFVTEQSQGVLKVFDRKSVNDTVSFNLGNVPYSIVMYDDDQQPWTNPPDGCDSYGCEHMCVEDPVAGPRCLCGEGYDLDTDMKECNEKKSFPRPSHLYAIGVAICMYPALIADMSLDNVTLASQCFLSDRFGYLALTFDAAENRLYYSGNYTSTISVIPLEAGAKAQVVASGTGTVRGLALDWVAGTLYWTDSANAHIKTSRKDGRFQRVLLEKDVNNPLGIAVHPAKGKIYWTDIGFQPDVLPKIESANMDGSEREVILKDNLGQPNHIMVDYNTDRLYWADSTLNHIRQYDLNTKRMTVFFQQSKVKFFGLSLYKDYILWTDTEDMNGIHVARLDTARKVRGIIHPNSGVAADLITFDPLLQPNLTSPCNNSGCDQLCLPKGASDFTCACGLGFVLTDQNSCGKGEVAQDQFILVNDAYQRNMYQVDGRKGQITAMTWGERHQPIAIGFHPPPAGLIYWSDNTAHVVRRKALGSDVGPETFMTLPEDSVVDGLAIDYINNLLFYTDTGRDLIGVVSMTEKTPRQAVVISGEGMDEPRAIVLSTADAKIYWTDWGANATINEASMNGQDRRVLMRFNQTAWPNGLAIDTKERALYWADANNNHIGVLRLDTGHSRVLLMEPQAHYFGLFLMGDFLYVTDWKRNYVARMHKQSGPLMQFGEDKFTKLYGITGYNSTETARGGTGVCADQSKCDNVSLCVPHSLAAFTCVCITGYQRTVGPRCEKVIVTTATTSTTTTTTTTTAAGASSSKTTTSRGLPTNISSSTTTTTTSRPTENKSSVLPTVTTTRPDHRVDVTTGSPAGGDDKKGGGSSNNSGDSGSGGKGGGSDSGDDGSGTNNTGDSTTTDNSSSHMRTGMVVAAVVGGVAVLLALVLAAYFYFRRRRGYQVPHTRLSEDTREKGGRGSSSSPGASPTSSTPVSPRSSSISKVVYARHNSSSNSSVRFDEGFENPTYDVTMAMMSAAADEEQPAVASSFANRS